MTIASEIEDLATNLTSAKNMVTAKGGTVGDTGLAGLAGEIATIPTGGVQEEWGHIVYKDSNDEHTVVIATEDEYLSLASNDNTKTVTINNNTFQLIDILEVHLGVHASYAPNYFLYRLSNLRAITGVDNLIYVGNDILEYSLNFSTELNFSRLVICGNYFLANNNSFNGVVLIPEIATIGSDFMRDDTAFSQTLTLSSHLKTIGTNFLYKCNNFTNLVCNDSVTSFPTNNNMLATTNNSAPMYTTGITLTGTHASAWKTAYPDKDTSPYRKLILGS